MLNGLPWYAWVVIFVLGVLVFVVLLRLIQMLSEFAKTWAGLTNFNGRYIWTDGENSHHDNSTYSHVLPATRHNYVDDNKYNSLFGIVTKCRCNTLSARFVFSNE